MSASIGAIDTLALNIEVVREPGTVVLVGLRLLGFAIQQRTRSAPAPGQERR